MGPLIENQLDRINWALQRSRSALFYRERLPNHCLHSVEEFRSLPLTFKEDLVRHSPFGFVSVPLDELRQYHETFGTTSATASTWLNEIDLRDNADQVNTCGVQFRPDDVVLIRFPYAISLIAHMVHRAVQDRGGSVIAASSRSTISPFPRVIELMQKLHVTVLAGLPMQMLLIAETAELLGMNPATDFPTLRALVTGGEPLSTGKRKLLERIWGVPVFELYGTTETGTMATGCSNGRLHLLEDYYLFEVLKEDLRTEAAPDEIGYLVITTLTEKATPLVRYVTNDRVIRTSHACPCGNDEFLQVRGRRQEIISIEGKHIDLWDLDAIVSHLPCQRFWVAGPDEKGLKLIVEAESTEDQVTAGTQQRMEQQLGLPLDLQIVPKGTLYNRDELLSVGVVGKPRYIYTAAEMANQKYLSSVKV
ncbi:phenylacetate--CoA ligase family protein [Heliobacterium chlorum]|uniref:Phenylacetate--CoA ligase family protein n=1 Tax=Heliobacterium chlorum TaxID=2698 RepID=A0ABR7T1M3_HELCL|nr:AMP-binding protein [Heliobacterium chlorum]MBC9783744.1 phenylacetate--CoA ligase family protein [Heliobacterium chlorum]